MARSMLQDEDSEESVEEVIDEDKLDWEKYFAWINLYIYIIAKKILNYIFLYIILFCKKYSLWAKILLNK